MKQKYSIIFLAALFAVFSCVQVDESVLGQEQEQVEMVSMSVSATIEQALQTKTALDGSLSDATIHTVWSPADAIGVAAKTTTKDSQIIKFETDIEESASVADFHGTIQFATEYHAFYPYSETLRDSSGVFIFSLPQAQKYVAGSFDPQATPMVAKALWGESFDFQNLCGILALQIKGEETVESITFIGKDAAGTMMPVSGKYKVDMAYESEPAITSDSNQRSVTLECETPVVLSKDEATPFYFVLPPATYSSFYIMIHTADGKIMFREGTNPLTVARSHVKPTSALKYAESIYLDLSEIGWSNCYVVPQAGLYSFDATVIGNGEYGLVPEVRFHTTDVKIEPKTVDLLWEDRADLITGLTLKDGEVRFFSTGVEGNALVAVRDESGKILWSWHLWMTDQPQEQRYVNDYGTFTMLDRNNGAIRNDRGTGEEWRESIGTFYQWGRKDPFAVNKYTTYYEPGYDTEDVIENPTVYVHSHSTWTTEWNQNLWDQYQKTIYDPCPVGYRVPPMAVWNGFSKSGDSTEWYNMNVSGAFDLGWNFIYDGSNTSWYPVTGRLSYEGWYEDWADRGRLWTSHMASDAEPAWLDFTNSGISLNNWDGEIHHGYSVRCMKDEGHVDTSYPTVKITTISEVTSSSATLVANVTDEGISEIIERGVIWGLSEDISLENADNATCDPGKGEYTMTIDGLSHSTRYYIKAYAINEKGMSYSKAKSFYTPYEGNAVDLSRNGTANCYIVPVAYSDYVFDASVKGNSKESVGAIASVEVLWETRNTTHALEVGDVIESVELEGNNVKFRLPFDCKPGNALIAVKDANGTILWSWHIWVVDFDPFRSGQVYIGGNMLMDRNLGALSVVPSNDGMDYSAYGLYYQWGRKDPSPLHGGVAPSNTIIWYTSTNGYNSLEASISNPNVFVAEIDWNTSDKWSEFKTMYDPCPVGWRVPQSSAWDNITENVLTTVNNRYKIIPEPYSVPAAYYPLGGEYISVWPGFNSFNSYAYWWYTDYVGGTVRMSQYDSFSMTSNNSSYGLSVRCMKDADFSVKTKAATNVMGTTADIAGSWTVNDGTDMEAVGFIYWDDSYSHNTSLVLNGEAVHVVEVAGTPVEFKVTLTGLKPNTRYQIRAYAKGGYNVRYGDIVSITTTSAGNGENFGNGGDYEWE